MTMPDDIPIGERIRFYRQGQHKSQAVGAVPAEITEKYLPQIERGLKTPTVGVLQRLAAVRGAPVSVLLGEPAYASESAIHPIAPTIQAALMSRRRTGTDPIPAPVLRARVSATRQIWQAAALRFTGIALLLPEVITDVQQAQDFAARRGDQPTSTGDRRCA